MDLTDTWMKTEDIYLAVTGGFFVTGSDLSSGQVIWDAVKEGSYHTSPFSFPQSVFKDTAVLRKC